MWRTDTVKPAPDSWSVVFDPNSPYKGKVTVYDDSVFIADAAVYLKATQPDLNITNPYELDDTQFQAAVDLLKQQKAIVGEYWADLREGRWRRSRPATAWSARPGSRSRTSSRARRCPSISISPKEGATGWSDTWMINSKAAHPELHVPLDGPHRQPADECDADGVLRRSAFEFQVLRARCLTRRSASSTTQTIEAYWKNIALLDYSPRGLWRRPRRGLQGPTSDWVPGLDRDQG